MAKIIDLKLQMKDGVTKVLHGVRRQTDETCKGFDALKGQINVIKNVAKGMMAYFAVDQLIDFGKELHNAWEVQRKAEQAVNDSIYSNMTALGASQEAIDKEVKAYKDLASELQGVGVIGDEVTLSGMAQATQMGLTAEQVKELTPLMQDLAVKQNGVNVSQEQFTDVAKDMANMVNMGKLSLQKYGIQVTDVEKKAFKSMNAQERYRFVIDKLNNSVVGMNKKLAETPEGKIARINNEIGDIKEQLGQQIDIAIEPMLTPILNFVKWLNSDFGSYIDTAKQAVKDFYDDNAVFFNALNDVFRVWEGAFNSSFDNFKNALYGLKDVATDVLTIIGGLLKGDILGVLTGFKDLAKDVCETVGNLFKGMANAVIGALAEMCGAGEEWRAEQERLKEQAQFASNPQNYDLSNSIGGAKKADNNALGTSYFGGGLTHINEMNRGEVVNLPSGTQIIPHDVATKQSASNTFNINVNVQGNMIGNEEYANQIGDTIFNKLQFAMNNM